MSVKTPVTSDSRRRLALWLLCAASLMIILDGTIVTVALPSIQRQLGPARSVRPSWRRPCWPRS
jgi:hypothetical protein